MDREQPLISIDVVAVRTHHDQIEYALHRRPFEPYIGDLALPGVLLLPGERVAEAANRAIASKLQMSADAIRYVSPSGVFDETNRDPRGATISLAHIAVVDTDADNDATWVALWHDEEPQLPFDHNSIIGAALTTLSERMWHDWDFTRALLSNPFTTSEALMVSRALDAVPSAPSKFSRWLTSTGRFVRAEDQSGFSSRDTRWEWA